MLPLRRKWGAVEELKDAIEKHDAEPNRKLRKVPPRLRSASASTSSAGTWRQAILDPACGSGNFLYVALRQLLDLDDEVVRLADVTTSPLNPIPYVRPVHGTHGVMGIEINARRRAGPGGHLDRLPPMAQRPRHDPAVYNIPILNKLDCYRQPRRDSGFDRDKNQSLPPDSGPRRISSSGIRRFWVGNFIRKQKTGGISILGRSLRRHFYLPSISATCAVTGLSSPGARSIRMAQ